MINNQTPDQETQSAVKQRREELNMTQRELAERSGVTVQTISNIENGRYKEVKLSPKQLKGISLALGWEDVHDIPDEWLPQKPRANN